MSKASEYADLVKKMNESELICKVVTKSETCNMDGMIASVDNNGNLAIFSSVMCPESALILGRWILDKFEDK